LLVKNSFRYTFTIENTASLRRGLRRVVYHWEFNIMDHRKHRLAQKRIKTLWPPAAAPRGKSHRKHRLAQKRIKTVARLPGAKKRGEIENTASLRRGLRQASAASAEGALIKSKTPPRSEED